MNSTCMGICNVLWILHPVYTCTATVLVSIKSQMQCFIKDAVTINVCVFIRLCESSTLLLLFYLVSRLLSTSALPPFTLTFWLDNLIALNPSTTIPPTFYPFWICHSELNLHVPVMFHARIYGIHFVSISLDNFIGIITLKLPPHHEVRIMCRFL